MNDLKYMLDTNICIYLIKEFHPSLLKIMATRKASSVCISVITLAELEFGIKKSGNPAKNRLAVEKFLESITVLPFDKNASIEYGDIRASLQRLGTPIGPNDLFIAAHAKSLGYTLVTNNMREFCRVDGLSVENWVS